MLRRRIKKLLWRDLEIIADRKKLFQRRKCLSGRNVIHIPSAVPQICLLYTSTLDHNELCEGVWLHRDEIPSRENDVSLTAEMIERFRLGLE